MITVPGLSGNQKNIRFLAESFRRGKLSHAFIIEGNALSGKELFADRIAAALLCGHTCPGTLLEDPCGRCPACVKTATGNHPDLIHVRHEKETVLSVGEIREQVVADIAIKPYYGPYKIYIIPDAQLMNEAAQNALLKTIEEPAPYGLIFLLTDNADGFLQTIRSRCIRISMDEVPREQIAASLLDEDGQRIMEILQEVSRTQSVRSRGPVMDAVSVNKAAKELEGMDRQQVQQLVSLWVRDLLFAKCSPAANRLYFRNYREWETELSGTVSWEGLNRIRLAQEEAQSRLKANVKAEAVYENLLFAIRREAQGS